MRRIARKRVVIGIAVVTALLSSWFVHSKIEAHRAQAQREAVYQQQLDHFQRDMRLGTSRAEVKRYLDSKKISYSRINSNLDVRIGEDPSEQWYCDRFYVYVEFRFSHLKGQTEPLPLDNLSGISIQRIGTCL